MKYKYLFWIFILSIIFSAINFKTYIKGDSPSWTNIIASATFILILLFITFKMRDLKFQDFFKIYTLYWGSGILVLSISYVLNWTLISIIGCMIFLGPIYGIKHFSGILFNMPTGIIYIVLTYILSLMGYVIGQLTKR